VSQQVTTYRIVRRYTHEVLGYGEVNIPPHEFETTAYWMAFQPETAARLAERGLLLLPNNYGPNWPAQRAAARGRDGFRCTRCGAHEPPDREHHVHHITPFRQFGYVPGENDAYLEANHISNLITLCPACHRAVEAGQGTRSALAGLVNALGSVAVLLLMCAPGDIGLAAEAASEPTLTIYDGVAGGLGFAERLYELHADLLEGARALVRDCACPEGCPACVGPVGEVGVDAKAMTLALLDELL
jgi:DEAD/DEAH box helicase domain-containing protein